MKHALINVVEGIVENSIILDDESDFQTPDGYLLIASEKPIGTRYVDGEFVENQVILPSDNDLVKQQILLLEASITRRRLREAILGGDDSWLSKTNTKIAKLRKKLA